MKYLFEKRIMAFAFILLSVIGVVVRLMLRYGYRKLLKSTFKMGESSNRLIKHMKKKYETCYNLDINVHNVDSFVDKCVYQYRVCGCLLSTWENISGQILLITLLSMPVIVVWAYIFGCGLDDILFTLAIGMTVSAILILVDKGINLKFIKTNIKINSLDYLENFFPAKLKKTKVRQEEPMMNKEKSEVDMLMRRQNKDSDRELVSEKSGIMISKVEEKMAKDNIDLDVFLDSLSEIAAGKDKWNKERKKREYRDNMMDDKVIEEVLREFFT